MTGPLRIVVGLGLIFPTFAFADDLSVVDAVDDQPLAAQVARVGQALDLLGSPLPANVAAKLTDAVRSQDSATIQSVLDARVLLEVSINPEARVKVARGPAPAVIQQAGYTPVLVKIVNDSAVKAGLRVHSPQAGPV